MADFIDRDSIVRKIWGNSDLVLLIFAGSAAEFALNKAVDWLFFTNNIPEDPIGRLFSTARFAQEIVFVDEETAQRSLDRINAIHKGVESERRDRIPDWAYRDVLYMLIDYSERAQTLLYGPLTRMEQEDLYFGFKRVGQGLHIPELPTNYTGWKIDRQIHLERDLAYTEFTSLLYTAYRRHLGWWRYDVLREVQGVLVPETVRRLLGLDPPPLLSELARIYGFFDWRPLRSLAQKLLIPSEHLAQVKNLNYSTPAAWRVS